MQQQLPQIPHLTRRHPDARKPPFHQQLQDVLRVSLIRLLLFTLCVPIKSAYGNSYRRATTLRDRAMYPSASLTYPRFNKF